MRHTIGVDVGGTKVLAGRVREDGVVLATRRVESDVESAHALVSQIASVVAELIGDEPVAGVGVGLPGTIDQRRGMMVQGANLPFTNAPARDLLSAAIGQPVEIENDAGCAALAEHIHGAAVDADCSVMLTLGTGVGGGIIVEGHPFRGASGAGGELGHIVVDRFGPPCQGTCPGRGHLEVYTSGTAFGRMLEEHAAANPDGTLAAAARERPLEAHLGLELAAAGDAEALALLVEVGRWLGAGLVTLGHAFEPEVFVIGGGFGEAAGEWILDPARETLRTGSLQPMNAIPVLAATLGGDAGMLGAAAAPTAVSAAAPRGRLRVCATPIGNLGDASPRLLEALRTASVVACEDTRRTATLLAAAEIQVPLIPLHAHNEGRRTPELVRRLQAGDDVCLVSDAGMPTLSDPGATLIQAAIDAGVTVEVLPGPSAITTALASSGLPTERFAFLGFLPRQASALERLLDEADRWRVTLVAFEAPTRAAATLGRIAARAPERPVALCRELTKLHEQVLRGSAAELAAQVDGPLRGEVTLVLAPLEAAAAQAPDGLDDALVALRAAGVGARESARIAALLTGLPARSLYDRATAAGTALRRP